uniref:Reverse transcriptase domain-containing protein n=1 Tax=Tanacetum cinerariifolium TaxID=118510 RepID=A0A6L2MLS4_TANCI|nr:hypothetical protein [Tanacetum cinerariifolium]
MLVEVGKFTFSANFVILEIKEDNKVPFILGRPFLHTADVVIIDVIDEIIEEYFDVLLDKESKSDTKEPPFEKISFNADYKIKTSLEEPPTDLKLKPLPDNMKYVFLEEPSFLPVIISSQLSEENKNKLISHCKDAHLVLNWEKCHFMVKEGIVLGHKISEACLDVDKAKINVISKLPPPLILKTIMHTDHSALRHLFKKKMLNHALSIGYCPYKNLTSKLKIKGTKNVAANHLSRIENDETSDASEVDYNFPREALMEINTRDEPWFTKFANYFIRPETQTILDQCHHEPTGGRYGPNTTTKKVLDLGFYWLTIIKEAQLKFAFAKHVKRHEIFQNVIRCP